MSTGNTDSSQLQAHLGTWTNWSRGQIFGATLTLTQSDANLLIAFMAFFVAYVGVRLWRIFCLAFHFIFSSRLPQDGVYHQRQAMLRNSSTPEAGFIILIELMWAWRHKATQSTRRLVLLTLFTAASIVGFTLAGGFSSKISSLVSSEVLLVGTDCALLDSNKMTNSTAQSINQYYYPYYEEVTADAANYAAQCYGANASRVLGCQTYPTEELPFTIDQDAPCPFQASICKSPTGGNLRFDTGLLDSHEHFGLNAPPSQRFQFRRVFSCAPLVTEGRKSVFNVSSDRSYTRYYYGPTVSGANFTMEFSNDDFFELRQTNFMEPAADYSIGVQNAIFSNQSLNTAATWAPDDAFFSTPDFADGDLHILFLSAGKVLFTEPETDPWYSATKYVGKVLVGSAWHSNTNNHSDEIIAMPVYMQNEPASPMGCKMQEQYCNRNLPGDDSTQCTPLAATGDAADDAFAKLSGNAEQERFVWAMNSIFGYTQSPGFIVGALGAQVLQSRAGLEGGTQAPLADQQWQIDMQYLFSMTLVYLQQAAVRTATGIPAGRSLEQFYRGPVDDIERNMCENLKIRSTAYLSFSLFGIYFTFILGGLIILTSYILDPIMACLRGRYGVRAYQQLEWATNDTLQLQRLAHEEIGVGTWTGATSTIPTTLPDEKLAPLDLSDMKHPRLLRMGEGAAETDPAEKGTVGREAPPLLKNLASVTQQSLLREPTLMESATNTSRDESEAGGSLNIRPSQENGLPEHAPAMMQPRQDEDISPVPFPPREDQLERNSVPGLPHGQPERSDSALSQQAEEAVSPLSADAEERAP